MILYDTGLVATGIVEVVGAELGVHWSSVAASRASKMDGICSSVLRMM